MTFRASILLWVMLKCVTTEFVQSKPNLNRPCDTQGTSLVEQFFNIVFAEFYQSPPTCTCVQMCPNQPTYCYPNGCFRGTEKKVKEREATSVSRLQHDGAKMFLFDSNNDLSLDFVGNVNSVVATSESTERIFNYNLITRPNTFKEMVFKYKRIPKLKMKYNLREQVKNTREKATEMDLSRTRWPTNKQIKHPYKVNHQESSRQSASALPETNQPETSKYFKRYLTKRENQNGLDISALYLYKDASNFSLESLIDDSVERGLEGVNNTLELINNNPNDLNHEDNEGDSKLSNNVSDNLDATRFYLDVNISDQNNLNQLNQSDTSDLLVENEKRDYNVDNMTVANSTSLYFDKITTLSKEIERQNNASIEVVENMTGKKFEDFSEESIPKLSHFRELVNKTRNAAISDLRRSIEFSNTKESSSDKVTTDIRKVVIPVVNGQVKKSKQRLVRKLKNRKLN